MRRRDFLLGALGSTAVAGSAHPQPTARMRRIAILHLARDTGAVSESGSPPWRSFFAELRRHGYVEGRNLTVDRHPVEVISYWERGPDIAAEVVGRSPEIIMVTSALWARRLRIATTRIPIVALVSDPVGEDLVSNLVEHKGNVTGVTTDLGLSILSKQLELLLEAAPDCSYFGCLGASYTSGGMRGLWRDARARNVDAREFLVHKHFQGATAGERYAKAFAEMVRDGTKGILVFDSFEHLSEAATIADLALHYRLPLVSPFRKLTETGGLMSYGPNLPALERRRAAYVAQLLGGTRPEDLPFEQPTELEFIINRTTAQKLGRDLSAALTAFADEVVM